MRRTGDVTWKVGILLVACTVGAVALGYALVQMVFLPETLAEERLDRVPDLTGATVEEAIERGRDDGYAVVVVGREHDPDTESGRVLYQVPSPDTYLPAEDTLRLLVSLGPGSTTMPDLAGLEPELAERVLGWLGMTVAATRRAPSDLHAQGTVVESVPPAGVSVEKGTAVTLVLSGGGSFLAMPDVRTLSLAAARDTLETYGLTVGDVSGVDRASEGERRVVVTGQVPAPGRRTRAGTAVRLQLGEVASRGAADRATSPPRRESLPTPTERPDAERDRFDRPPPSLDGTEPGAPSFEDVPVGADTTGGGA